MPLLNSKSVFLNITYIFGEFVFSQGTLNPVEMTAKFKLKSNAVFHAEK